LGFCIHNYCICLFVSCFENQNQISATFPLEKGFVWMKRKIKVNTAQYYDSIIG